MKRIFFLPCAASLILSACNSDAPLGASGDYDPFVAPGMNRGGVGVLAKGIKRGTMAFTLVDNAAFFKKRPDGNANADRLLKKNIGMKVISDDQSYAKVELDSGEVGYIPSVQIGDQKVAASSALAPVPHYNPGAVQVYPQLPTSPGVPSAPLPAPEQPAIPPVIDPESSAPQLPVTPPVEKSTGQ